MFFIRSFPHGDTEARRKAFGIVIWPIAVSHQLTRRGDTRQRPGVASFGFSRCLRVCVVKKRYLISFTGNCVPKSCPLGATARATIDVNACLYSGYCCARALMKAMFCWKVFT